MHLCRLCMYYTYYDSKHEGSKQANTRCSALATEIATELDSPQHDGLTHTKSVFSTFKTQPQIIKRERDENCIEISNFCCRYRGVSLMVSLDSSPSHGLNHIKISPYTLTKMCRNLHFFANPPLRPLGAKQHSFPCFLGNAHAIQIPTDARSSKSKPV